MLQKSPAAWSLNPRQTVSRDKPSHQDMVSDTWKHTWRKMGKILNGRGDSDSGRVLRDLELHMMAHEQRGSIWGTYHTKINKYNKHLSRQLFNWAE